jgi:hypothetical protein
MFFLELSTFSADGTWTGIGEGHEWGCQKLRDNQCDLLASVTSLKEGTGL